VSSGGAACPPGGRNALPHSPRLKRSPFRCVLFEPQMRSVPVVMVNMRLTSPTKRVQAQGWAGRCPYASRLNGMTVIGCPFSIFVGIEIAHVFGSSRHGRPWIIQSAGSEIQTGSESWTRANSIVHADARRLLCCSSAQSSRDIPESRTAGPGRASPSATARGLRPGPVSPQALAVRSRLLGRPLELLATLEGAARGRSTPDRGSLLWLVS